MQTYRVSSECVKKEEANATSTATSTTYLEQMYHYIPHYMGTSLDI